MEKSRSKFTTQRSLYKDKEVPAAVGSGSIESGVASLTRYVGDIPAVDLFYQPFLLNTDQKVRKAVSKGSSIRGPIDNAIKNTGSTVSMVASLW